jgi:hypothetical protein
MNEPEDQELEARLRRIASGTRPEPPARLHRRLHEIAAAEPARTVMGVTVVPVRPTGRTWPGLRTGGMLAAVAATIVLAAALSGLFVAQRGGGPGATWAPRTDVGTGQWTALEWHDVTATAGGLAMLSSWDVLGRDVTRWQGGLALLGGDFRAWISTDGLTWSPSPNLPKWAQLASVDGGRELLAVTPSGDGTPAGVWRSGDGRNWQRVAAPFEVKGSESLSQGTAADLLVGRDNSVLPNRLGQIWHTTDGGSWELDTLPADLASARNVMIQSFAGGFVAVGFVSDAKGNQSYCDDAGNCESFSYRAWSSSDGRTWSAYDRALPSTGFADSTPPWTQVRSGSLGMTDGSIYSTDGGATWQAETAVGHMPTAKVRITEGSLASDGSRVIGAAGSIAHLYLTECDGRWVELEQGGDVRSLPSTGQLVIVPGGVLWIAADRVYFGQALSGIVPRGSLGPPITPIPGSSPTLAGILPTSSPAVAPPSTSTPTALNATSALTTHGLLTSWTGFSWSSGQKSASNAIGRVIKWRGGYAAIDTSSNPGRALWTSSDGQVWTRVTALPPYWYELAASPNGLVVIVVDYGARSAPDQTFPTPAPYSAAVWTSSDGVTWQELGSPDIPCMVSLAGTAAGLVATVAQPGSTGMCGGADEVDFSNDGLHWTPMAVEPGIAWDTASAPTVETDGSRFFLMGETTAALGLRRDQAAVVLTSSMSRSYAWWSDDGRTWTRSGGSVGANGTRIDFGRDGMVMTTNFTGFMPGGAGMAVSTDGGKTWAPDSNFGPLGAAQCSGECSTAADGVIGGNGTYLVAVKNGGTQAWLSSDGVTWTQTPWSGGDPSSSSANGFGGFTVLPRGVLLTGVYGAAH